MALQTNVEQMKNQLLAEGEHEIMTVRRHFFRFVMDFFVKTFLALALIGLLGIGAQTVRGMDGFLVTTIFFVIIAICYFYQIIKSYIAWRFNFLIITSDKIVVIEQRSFIHHKVNSVHLDTVARSDFESQYFGFFRCGVVHIHLKEQVEDAERIITIRDVPTPDTIASAIENSIGLKQQRSHGAESPAVQEEKADVIKENLKVEAKTPPVNTPSPPPAPVPPA